MCLGECRLHQALPGFQAARGSGALTLALDTLLLITHFPSVRLSSRVSKLSLREWYWLH